MEGVTPFTPGTPYTRYKVLPARARLVAASRPALGVGVILAHQRFWAAELALGQRWGAVRSVANLLWTEKRWACPAQRDGGHLKVGDRNDDGER